MNMRAHELVSGYIAGIANSDTEFHIKYAPYTFFGITIQLSLYAMKTRSARGWAQNNGFTRWEFYIILFLKYEPISERKVRRMLWNATTRAIRLMWRS